MNEAPRGSAWVQWNEDLRKRYIRILDSVINTLMDVPKFPPYITEMDVLKLREAAHAMGYDVEDLDLSDSGVFYDVRGELVRMAIEKVEEQLRPSNTLEDMLDNIPQEWKDLYWNPEALKKKLLGDEDGEE